MVTSFEIASDWKFSFIKLIFLFRLARLLRLRSCAHRATELLFSLAKERKLLALGSWMWVFSCPTKGANAYWRAVAERELHGVCLIYTM